MASDKTLKLSIWIAGKMDKSLTAAISSANSQISSLSTTMSKAGTAGLAAMSALATGTAVALWKCTKEAESFEASMADVVKYVNGIADTTGKISDSIWSKAEGGNGQTYAENYKEMSKALLDLSTQIPMTAEDLTKLAAAAGQSGKNMNDLISYDSSGNISGFLKDVAMVGTAMDITAEQAGDWAAKWEKSLSMSHDEVMVLFDQINYLGANSATTAAEIAEVVNGVASLGEVAGMDAASTAALSDAMLAMGVDASTASTSISRMLVNMSKGTSATSAQQKAWESLGFTAEGVAKSMQTNAAGTMLEVLEAIGNMDADKKVATLSTLFGQWAIKGAAKLTGNLSTYTDALKMVTDSSLYTGSMEREFIIKSSTSEAIDTMMSNAFEALQIDIGTEFLPAKKEFSLMMIDSINGLRENMPQLSTLATSAAQLLSTGVEAAGNALQSVMPYIQEALDYLLNNGDKVIKAIEGIGAAFLGMKFAPQVESAIKSVGTLLTGKGGLGSLLASGNGQKKGRKLGGVLGTVRNLFTGGQNAAANATATVPNLISTAGSIFSTARTDAQLNGTSLLGTLYSATLGQTRTGGGIASYIGSVGTSLGNVGQALGNTGIGTTIGTLGTNIGDVIGTLGGNIENALNTVTLPIRKGIAGIGASAIINGSILQQSAAGLIGNIANSGVGQAVGNTLSGVSSVLSSGAGLLGSIWGPIAGGFGSLLAGAAPVVAAISGIIAVVSILGDHLEDIRGIVGNVFGDTGLAIFDAFADKLGGIADFITGLFSDGGVANALAPLRDGFSNLLADGGFLSTIFGGQGNGLAAFDGVVQILQSILGVAGQVVTFATETMKPIIQDIFSFITETVVPIVLQTFESAAPAISNIVSGLGSAVMTGMQIIGTAIQTALPIIEGVIATILSIGSVAIPAVLSAFGVFSQGIADIMADIQQIFGGLISFVTGVFTGDWSKAWNGIKDVFGGAFNALVDLCKTPINAVISIINSAISHINKLGITIPDWVPTLGGKNFSINIPKIPMLANGGFTAGPSIAGEAGQEAVISFKPSERARNVSLWEQAGDLLGVNRIKLDEIERDDRGWNGNSDGSGITFAPQITIQGNADTAVMQEAITEMRSQFETWYEEMQRRKLRTAY